MKIKYATIELSYYETQTIEIFIMGLFFGIGILAFVALFTTQITEFFPVGMVFSVIAWLISFKHFVFGVLSDEET